MITKPQMLLLLLVLFACVQSNSAQTPNQNPTSVTPIAAKPLVDQSAPPGWQRYQIGERPEFSIILPAVPEADAEKSPNSSFVTHMYSAKGSNGIYIVSRMEGVTERTAAQQEKFFKDYFVGFAKGFADGVAAKRPDLQVQYTEASKVNTASGREGFQQEMTIGSFKARAQLVFLDSSAFTILAIWNDQTPATEYETFFKSFRLTTAKP